MRVSKFFPILVVAAFCASCAAPKDYSVNEYRTTMQFHDNFRIMQLADLHLGIESDLNLQLNFIEKSIKHANPDLIVLTGDNFMYGTKSIVRHLFKRLNDVCDQLSSFEENKLVKFAVTYGNHDNQGDYPRYFLNETIKQYVAKDGDEFKLKKYAAFLDYEDDNLFGFTNYFIDLVDDRTKSPSEVDVKYRVHIVDSNTYKFTGIKYGYDVIHEEQLNHTIDIYNNSTVDKDYVGLMFFHIPFAEFEDARSAYINASEEERKTFGQGEFGEGVSDPYENNGSYKKLRSANIVSYHVGHDHINQCDIIHNHDKSIDEKAIFSYGVKSTNQLYHDDDMIGYKLINLEKEMSVEEFVSIENINKNFIPVLNRGSEYENK